MGETSDKPLVYSPESSIPLSEAEQEELALVPSNRDPETGKFLPGKSGNPKGRTKGARSRITLARLLVEEGLRRKLANKADKLLDRAIDMALDGNDRVMRALLDKMLTTPKEAEEADAVDREIRVIINNLTSPEAVPAVPVSKKATYSVTATPLTVPEISKE